MRHGLLNGGKRLRPFLVIQSAALFDVTQQQAMQTACALECLHSYSLVHDDLPAMDDDDLRRGKPTVHKAFDEATAILAGDAPLTLAFDMLSDPACHPDPQIRAQLTNRLARASGLGGMIGGQMLDLADAETMGKAVGKDADRGKGTLVGILGVARVEELLADAVNEANTCLAEFGDKAEVLRQTTRFIVERQN